MKWTGQNSPGNGCPSRGTVDIFIEPYLPMPELVVIGASPVAIALKALAPQFHWSISEALAPDADTRPDPVAVIATQGQGDLDALKAALATTTKHIAFVGSARKYASLAEKLEAAGFDRPAIDAVKAPAGLSIGAVTPEEIALSILADLVQLRRAPSAKEPSHG